MLDTNSYFLRIQKGLEKQYVVDKPSTLTLPDNYNILHGKVMDYNRRTGVVRIKLFDRVHFSTLIMCGVPFDYIIFEAQA